MNQGAIEIESTTEVRSDIAAAIIEMSDLQLMLVGGGNVEVIVG